MGINRWTSCSLLGFVLLISLPHIQAFWILPVTTLRISSNTYPNMDKIFTKTFNSRNPNFPDRGRQFKRSETEGEVLGNVFRLRKRDKEMGSVFRLRKRASAHENISKWREYSIYPANSKYRRSDSLEDIGATFRL